MAGPIVGWGRQAVVPESALTGLTAVAAGFGHSVGLKADGSVVTWGEADPPPVPNVGFTAIAAGTFHVLGIRGCYADCNWDGALNLADFGCFQTMFATGQRYADRNDDGVLGLADFGCFQAKFALGCP
jgi:alpha-tubulin suppressor-like RCC1 family protein